MSGAPNDGRSPMAVAMQWVSQLTTIALEMALPPLGGYWLDAKYGTSPWLVVVGAVLGFVTAMWHLLQLVKVIGKRDSRNRLSK